MLLNIYFKEIYILLSHINKIIIVSSYKKILEFILVKPQSKEQYQKIIKSPILQKDIRIHSCKTPI